jgi:hypothetical protein
MTRKLGSAGLALSVLFALISLVAKGGVGVTRADGIPDLNITDAKAEITHETANACLNQSISCQTSFYHSDSYEILADLALNSTGDFQSDLNQTIFIALSAGNCTNLNANNTVFSNSTYVAVIPGASLHKHTNKNFTIYTFEGNIPGITPGSFPLFDHAEFSLKIPTLGSPTLSLAGNANLCPINGPMALSIFGNPFGETPSDSDVDFGCVNIPAPEFNTLDISSAFCPIF